MGAWYSGLLNSVNRIKPLSRNVAVFTQTFVNRHKKYIFWSVLFVIFALLFFGFIFGDILATTGHGVNLVQVISKGTPLDFYKLSYKSSVDTAAYDLPIYIIFAVWDLPLWIARNYFHVQITESLMCLLWIKLMLVAFMVMCAAVIKKICLEIKIDKKYVSWVIFAFISSPLLLMPLLIMGQYDIIPLLFILLGVLMYIRGNRKLFILFFSIAIPIKMFALFIFIPLLLLNNKKIIQIIKYIAFGLTPLIVLKLFSSLMPMYKESTAAFNGRMLSNMFSSSINVNLGSASLFCMAMIFIVVYCYQKTVQDKEQMYRLAIYIPLVVLASFFAFVRFNPQWIVLIVPFIVITLFQNMEKFRVNILLDAVISTSFLVVTTVYYYYCYSQLSIDKMIIPKLFGSNHGLATKYYYVSDLLNKFGTSKLMPFFLAAFVAGLISLVVVNFPKNHGSSYTKGGDKVEWGLLFIRMLIIVPIPILMIYCYYHI